MLLDDSCKRTLVGASRKKKNIESLKVYNAIRFGHFSPKHSLTIFLLLSEAQWPTHLFNPMMDDECLLLLLPPQIVRSNARPSWKSCDEIVFSSPLVVCISLCKKSFSLTLGPFIHDAHSLPPPYKKEDSFLLCMSSFEEMRGRTGTTALWGVLFYPLQRSAR